MGKIKFTSKLVVRDEKKERPFYEDALDHYAALKEQLPEDVRVRIHRSFSWLKRAAMAGESGDDDVRFITLWIAFNSAYGQEIGRGGSWGDKTNFKEFLRNICLLDKRGSGLIRDLLLKKVYGVLRVLLDDQFCYKNFWEVINSGLPDDLWREQLQKEKQRTLRAVMEDDTERVLHTVFERLYVIRNQLLHGGASCGSTVNRGQLKNGCLILESLIPLVLRIMLDNVSFDWGKLYYPVITQK